MHSRLHDYDNCQGFDISNEMELAGIPNGIFTGPPKSSCVTLKRNLLNAHAPRRLRKAIWENAMVDKKDEFKQSALFRIVSKIHTSKTFNDLAVMDFADYAYQATFYI